MEPIVTPPTNSQPSTPTELPRHTLFWNLIHSCWPAVSAVVLVLILTAITVYRIKAGENGHFVYTIDDTYLHMAIAKNLFHHGIWGVSNLSGFSWCSSSLIWPLIIAVSFSIFGMHEYIPFVLNILAAVGVLFYVGYLVRRTTGSNILNLLILLLVVVFTPILAVASTGMEHCLQVLFSIVFVDLAARLLAVDAQRLTSRSAMIWLCVMGALMTMTRYEGLFLVAPVGLLLLCQRRWILALSLGFIAVAPIILSGLVAVSKGWYFLPTSLMIKGNTHLVPTLPGVIEYLSKWYVLMISQQHMFTLLAAVTAVLFGSLLRRRTIWTYPATFLFITLVAFLQHLQFAGIGWFYRYEAYLIVLALVGSGVALGYEPSAESGGAYWLSLRAVPLYAVFLVAAALFGTPLWTRAIPSMQHIVNASYNIYEQQYQMGHFIRRYYQNKGVAANDVGAINYFPEIDILDTVGLTDIDVLRARRAGTFNHESFRSLSKRHKVEIVMIYDNWASMFGGILPEWVPIGRWTIPHNTVTGSDTVSFYAPSEEFVPKIVQQLKEFGATLPRDITQEGIYRGNHPLNETGTYPAQVDEKSTTFWTGSWAQFYVYPEDNEPLNSNQTMLKLAVYPISQGQTIEVFFNDQLVETKQFSPAEPIRWTPFAVKAKWHAGANTVKLVGHGTTIIPPGDGRTLLFMVLDPRQMMDDAGTVSPQRP